AAALIEVRILGLPVPLRERSTQHGDELVREMTLLAARAEDSSGAHVPQRLVSLAADVRSTYGVFTEHANAQMDAAALAGIPVIDEIVYHVPASTGPFCEHLLAIIDETDEFCRRGDYLLTLATPADVLRYQRWIIGEFVRQIRGEPAIPWPEFQPATG
ncbi:MAG: hypothetical protein QOK14_110, partial [Frankiaceae bacterium]|nr:hypothetical protein [Frankiaceae bacterium]